MVTDLGRVTPNQTTLSINKIEVRSKPWTVYRNTSRNLWQKPGEIPVSGMPMTPASNRDNNLFILRSRIGGEPFGVSHSVCDYDKRFGSVHPEWFTGKPGPSGRQLRYDNPEVIAQIIKDSSGFFDKPFPERRFGTRDTQGGSVSAGDYFSVAPADNRDFGQGLNPPAQLGRMQPGHFGNGVYSNYIFTCVNKVAATVLDKYPGMHVSTVTYERNGAWPGFNTLKPFYRLGTLYAVYDFLEDLCGIRWYMVTDIGTCIPKRNSLACSATDAS